MLQVPGFMELASIGPYKKHTVNYYFELYSTYGKASSVVSGELIIH